MLNNNDFSNAAIENAVNQAEVEVSLNYTPSKTEVEELSNGTFNPNNYWIMTLAGKNTKLSKFKVEELQQNAKSRMFSKIATLKNKGFDEEYIAEALKDSIEAQAFGGKRPDLYIKKMVAKQEAMDYFNHSERIFLDFVNHVAVLSDNKSLRQATKTAMPLFLLIPTLTSAVNSNRTAIVSTRYLARVVSCITRNIGTSANSDLAEQHQKRKWESYAKQTYTIKKLDKDTQANHINFIKGKAGGNSNNVEILKFKATTTQAQREKAVELILDQLAEGSFKTKLALVLNAVVTMDVFIHEDHCELSNYIADVIAEFKTIADDVIFNRKAERLIETADYTQAVADEILFQEENAALAAERVNAYMKSGKVLVAERSVVAVMEKTVQEATVEAPESDAEDLSINNLPLADKLVIWQEQKDQKFKSFLDNLVF